ncbi:MAG TPA: citrate (Si)-synthase [Caldithrix sp.]|nr:citrate (Si)-synthase [Caldithrix sp.]
MATLQSVLAEKIPVWREELRDFLKEHGDEVISEVTLQQLYGGLRGVKALLCDTSYVSPEKGLFIRGIPIADLTDRLPEEVFYLLCTGELPDEKALTTLQEDLKSRSEVPSYVWDTIKSLPEGTHPMVILSIAILSMQRQSVFCRKYSEGMRKGDHWETTLEDALQIIAKIPSIVAGIYRMRVVYKKRILSDPYRDWGGDFAHMLGLEDPDEEFPNLLRLYMVLHSDHEGGNVSANVGRIVNSALSDPYYSLTAALNGLAGPLHGLANQECLKYVQSIEEKFNGVPSEDELKEYVWATLNSGRVIPGYGHAVLRTTDPRFTALLNFGKRVCPYDNAFRIVEMLFKVVPGILKEHGKAKNPWPNVDAASGSLLYHFGMTRFDFYTVMFGASRILGISAQMIMNRGLFLPIFRPKSVTFDWLKQEISKPSGSKK